MRVIALTLTVIALAAGLAACGPSPDTQGKDHKSMDGKGGATHAAAGTVKSVDPGSGTVTLDHGPVPTLNWPAMAMAFKVRDKALLEKLQPGKKAEFEFVQQGKDYVITAVK